MKQTTKATHKYLPTTGGPVVALANGYRFGNAQLKIQPQIQSRAILWCRAGRGVVQVNQATFDMHAGSYLLLPWNRRMVYRAAAKNPFHLAAIHWIPSHAMNRVVQYDVAHEPGNKLANAPWRNDQPVGVWEQGVIASSFDTASALSLLVEYIVARFTQAGLSGPRDDRQMRELAELLITQLNVELQGRRSVAHSTSLQRLTQYMTQHCDEPLDLQHLSDFAGVSRATVLRLFRSELQTTPGRWLTEVRITKAQTLLRTTAMPIHAIGSQVGVPDAHYFSHVFKKVTGLTPRAYRAQRLVV